MHFRRQRQILLIFYFSFFQNYSVFSFRQNLGNCSVARYMNDLSSIFGTLAFFLLPWPKVSISNLFLPFLWICFFGHFLSYIFSISRIKKEKKIEKLAHII